MSHNIHEWIIAAVQWDLIAENVSSTCSNAKWGIYKSLCLCL